MFTVMMLFAASATALAQWPQSSATAPIEQPAVGQAGCFKLSAEGGSVHLSDLRIKTLFPKGDPEYDIGYGLGRGPAFVGKEFGVEADVGLYDDEQANALAIPTRINRYTIYADGIVLVGRHLITEERMHSGVFWGTSVTLIVAHEYAHIYQFKRQLRRDNRTLELHADFLAGWYLGLENRRTNGMFANVDIAAQSLFRKGDYEFNSSTSHGTPEQRVTALRAGYQLGTSGVSLTSSSDEGLTFVTQNLPPQ